MAGMHDQVQDAKKIIMNAIAEHGDGLCVGAMIGALDIISYELKEIALQKMNADSAVMHYKLTCHGEVVDRD